MRKQSSQSIRKRDLVIITLTLTFIVYFSVTELSREISVHGIDRFKLELIILWAVLVSIFVFLWLFVAFRRNKHRLREAKQVFVECLKIPKGSLLETEEQRELHGLCSHIIYSLFLFFALTVGFAEYVITRESVDFIAEIIFALFKMVVFLLSLMAIVMALKRLKKQLPLGASFIFLGILIFIFFKSLFLSSLLVTSGIVIFMLWVLKSLKGIDLIK